MMAAVRARIALSFALAGAVLCLVSCTRQAPMRTSGRLAVLRFENLGATAGDDWVGRAFEEILDAELAGAPELYAIPSAKLLAMDRALGARPIAAPGISAERAAALSAGAARIAYGDYAIRNGRLEAHVSLADPASGKIVAGFDAGADGGDVLAAASALAQRLSPHASGYSTRSESALHDYVDAMEAAEPAEAASRAEAAVAADPGFGPAARLLAEVRAGRGDRTGALECLNRALASAVRMPAAEQALLRLDIARLGNPSAALHEAYAAVAVAEPANPDAWMALGNFDYALRDFDRAAAAFLRSAELDPAPEALNQAAYAAAFGGHPKEAMASLDRYQALRPSDPNPVDSMGDVQLINGNLREAEALYLRAVKKDSRFMNGGDWLKAAMARLMTGDRAGADALSESYVHAHFAPQDPAADFHRAQWRFLSGRRRQGYRDLEALAAREAGGAGRALVTQAQAQMAIWSLDLGDLPAARTHVQAAMGGGPAAAIAAFLAAPPAGAAEWAARAAQLAPRPEQARVRGFALAQALLLGKHFDAALPVLRQAYESASPADPGVPVLLAWSYVETGQAAIAAPLLAHNPIPGESGIDMFTANWFPRLFFLRGETAAAQGKPDVARANYQLFLDLSGDATFQWGEEERARASLQRK